MELIKENVEILQVKKRAELQMTVDEDYNVPDAKADMGRLIQNKGSVNLDEVTIQEERAYIRGQLLVDVLYVGEEKEPKIHSMTIKVPIEETMNLEGIESGDKLCLKWEIEDLTMRVIHSRKLNIKALLLFAGTVEEIDGIRIPLDGKEEAQKKKENVKIMNLVLHKKDTVRIKETVTIASNKPNIRQILWDTMEIRGTDIRMDEGKMGLKGELFLFVLYEGQEEGEPLTWLECSIPFTSDITCRECMPGMIPDIEISMIHQNIEVLPDNDGEERMVQAEVVLELNMKAFQERQYQMLQDIYHLEKEYKLTYKEQPFDSLLVRNSSKCRLSARMPVKEPGGKILQICHSNGYIKVDRTRITETGILAEGMILCKVLYIVGDDAMPFYSTDVLIPFSHLVEARDIGEDCSYYLQTDLEQLSTTMIDSNEIEVKGTMCLNVLVLKNEKREVIESVEEEPLDLEKLRKMPSVTVYMSQPEDTLWDIAKEYHTTEEAICKMNHLEKGKLDPYAPMLLIKQV